MKILVLSDLHIGPSARCSSLVPEEELKNTHNDDRYFEHLEQFINKHSVIDYIILCGDLTDTASKLQFLHFDKVISKILSITALDITKVFVTFGNHDYDRRVFPADGTEITNNNWKSRYSSLQGSQYLSDLITNSVGDLIQAPYHCRWHDENIYVLSINTAAYEKPSDDVKSGYISPETIQSLEEQIKADNVKNLDKTKILLMHHHPINYPNPIPNWRDFSAVQCSTDMVNFACNNGFDLIIHGHRHQPKFKSELTESGDQITIIASGSFSCRFPFSFYELISNQIHLLEIEGRDPDSNVLKGSINNFAFTHVHGWRESKRDGDGIEHKISFGPNEHKHILVSIARNFIQERVDASGHCKIRDLVEQNTKFKYKSYDLIANVVETVCDDLDFETFGDTIEDSVILKRVDI